MGEIYGLANPTRLPAPTTSSLARTVIMWPDTECYSRLNIEDAERCQGLEAGHTALPHSAIQVACKHLEAQTPALPHSVIAACREIEALTPAQALTARFHCVGNGLHGEVWLLE
jgi:hypothetical protein